MHVTTYINCLDYLSIYEITNTGTVVKIVEILFVHLAWTSDLSGAARRRVESGALSCPVVTSRPVVVP